VTPLAPDGVRSGSGTERDVVSPFKFPAGIITVFVHLTLRVLGKSSVRSGQGKKTRESHLLVPPLIVLFVEGALAHDWLRHEVVAFWATLLAEKDHGGVKVKEGRRGTARL
jgi:hypothetical protein